MKEATVKFSGGKLRAHRLAKGLTQAELAHRAHVRERQIIRWENGQHVPRSGSVMALARVLKQPASSFFEGDDAQDDDGEGDPVADLVDAIRALVRAELSAAAEGRRAG